MKNTIATAFLIPTLLVPILLLTGCGSKPQPAETSTPQAVKPVTTATAVAESKEVPADFQVTGTFAADESSDIAPLVAGRVLATPVNVGDHVVQGQVVCELDHRDAQLRLDQMKALLAEANASIRQTQSRIGWTAGSFDANKVPEVAAAEANYKSALAQAKLAAADAQRYANLVATGDVSKTSYERARTQQETAEAQANAAKQQYEASANAARQSFEIISTQRASLDSVKAQVAQAEKALADTTIRAPFDGYITARPVAAGEYVALTNKIATIVRIGTMKLQLQTPEQKASLAHLGDKVTAVVAAYAGREFVGKVTAINQSVDPNSRIFLLEAHFDNPRNELKPGMFATARVAQPGGVQAVFVPKQAVIRDKTTDSNQVFVVENGKARLRVVQVGDASGESIRLVSGLNGGETVATTNLGDLFDGVPVNGGGAR
jgi:multidrug efflux pump subunit AcrA (membrane-fusion protein)